jgi:alginate O-acetyltransferase complex protein AlgI
MSFNSGVFLQFFAAFLLLYWLVRHRLALRNLLIVAASYLFYGWWDYRFLSLLLFSSVLDYAVGLLLASSSDPRRRKWLLGSSIVLNLSILGFFKYYNFFIESFGVVLAKLGLSFDPATLNIILPWGISFYTFQSMSYAIDVYRGQVTATRSLVNFLAYVSFFPQLVAGPIERARHLLPQFERTRLISIEMIEEGIWLALWGMFKKVVVADSLAPLVEMVFNGSTFSGPLVVLATVAFGLQIYCDFSGYSDIARGTARILGFDIMVNFNIPYAAKSLREFWQRWHISLSTWLRDYLYVPLGGNRRGPIRTYLNLLITMFLGGLWHGAAWNFVLWGIWHGVGLALTRMFGGWKLPRLLAWVATMAFVFYGWLLFRARSLSQISDMTTSVTNLSCPPWIGTYSLALLLLATPLIAMELWQIKTNDRLVALKLPRWSKGGLQALLFIGIALFWEQQKKLFIYFQF